MTGFANTEAFWRLNLAICGAVLFCFICAAGKTVPILRQQYHIMSREVNIFVLSTQSAFELGSL